MPHSFAASLPISMFPTSAPIIQAIKMIISISLFLSLVNAINWRVAFGQGNFSFSRLGITDEQSKPRGVIPPPVPNRLFDKGDVKIFSERQEIRDELNWRIGYNLTESQILPKQPRFTYEFPRWIAGFGTAWTFSLENGLTHPLPRDTWRLAFRYIDLFGPSRNPYRSGQGLAFLLQYEVGKPKKNG